MNTEGVATVLRQSGAHVQLIVGRSVDAAATASYPSSPLSVVVRANQMNEAFEQLNKQLLGEYMNPSDEVESQTSTLLRDNVSRKPTVSVLSFQMALME
jgi:uncharacterized protein (DUF39 family)